MVVGGGDELAELAAEEAEMRQHVARLESPAGQVESAACRLTDAAATAGVRHAALAPPRPPTGGTPPPTGDRRRAFCAAPKRRLIRCRRLHNQPAPQPFDTRASLCGGVVASDGRGCAIHATTAPKHNAHTVGTKQSKKGCVSFLSSFLSPHPVSFFPRAPNRVCAFMCVLARPSLSTCVRLIACVRSRSSVCVRVRVYSAWSLAAQTQCFPPLFLSQFLLSLSSLSSGCSYLPDRARRVNMSTPAP